MEEQPPDEGLQSAWVFPSETGETALDPKQTTCTASFIPRSAAPVFNDFRWHDLRHSAGMDIRTVQELMGHQTLRMTERYTPLSPAHKLEAVQRLARKPSSTTSSTGAEAAKVASQ